MLDVHPPHEAAHTWTDFFIHIATIVVGLLIAIGLEQTVEAIHHHHQLVDIREALRQERAQNRRSFAINVAEFRTAAAYLQNDMLVLRYLRQHPGTPESQLPGVLEYSIRYQPMIDAEWKTAQQTGVTVLMPRAEVTDNDSMYDLCSRINNDAFVVFQNINQAREYRSLDFDLSHFTPQQIDAQIKFTQDSLTSLFEWGVLLETLGSNTPDFTGKPTREDLDALFGANRSLKDTQQLLSAHQQTDARTQPAVDALHAAQKAAAAK